MEKVRVSPSRCKALEIGNSVYKSIYDFGLTPQDLEKAFRELNEKEEEREACIMDLKEKLKSDSKYRFMDDDEYLLSYLRYRKFDINRAYSTLCKAYSIRIKHSELFLLPPNLESLCDMGVYNLLPYRDEEGRLINWINFGKWNTEDMSLYEILQTASAVLDVAFMNPCCQIHGVVGIWDFKGFDPTARFMASVLNPRLWTLSTLWQDCLPHRVKLIILINCRSWIRKIFNSIKFLYRSKLVKRNHFHYSILMGEYLLSKKKIQVADIQEGAFQSGVESFRLIASRPRETPYGVKGKRLSKVHLFDTGATVLSQFFNPAILPKGLGGMIEDDECIVTGHVKDNMPYLKYRRSLEMTEFTLQNMRQI